MAIKTVGELPASSYIGINDLFVMEQGGTAKSMTGQVLTNEVAKILDGHGGIKSASLSNYQLILTTADGTNINVGNVRGAKGEKGNKGDTTVVTSCTLVKGDHSPGTTDTYRITFDNGTSYDIPIYNGAGADDVVAISDAQIDALF